MKQEKSDRIPFRVESPRGDDIIGTNGKTGEVISDHDAKEKGVPFQSGVPRDKIQAAIEEALKKEKWVCVEKTDGSTELLTKKDIPAASEVKPVEVPTSGTQEKPKESEKPATDDWKGSLNGKTAPVTKPGATKPPAASQPGNLKEKWESKFADIKSATATHKGKGG
jgi:hypothetical protein